MGQSAYCVILLVSFALALLILQSLALPCRIVPPYNDIALVRVSFPDPSRAQALRAGLRRICQLKQIDPERGFSNDLLLNADQLRYLRLQLAAHAVVVLDPDVGASFRREAATIAAYPRPAPLGFSFQLGATSFARPSEGFYKKWHIYADLENRWKVLNKTYSSLSLEVIGQSVEKRPIYAMRIGSTNRANPLRVLFNGMQHAREWITTMVTLYAAENFATDALNSASPLFKYLREVEVIILPMVNPDGFVYSHIKDRFWRKNRQNVTCSSVTLFDPNDTRLVPNAGVDLNRNWGKDFGGDKRTSDNPCSGIFAEKKAFSAPETAAVRDFVLKTPGILFHVDIHSYFQLVIGPWLHTNDAPPRAEEVDVLGDALARNLSSGGKLYKYGRGFNNNVYLASGTMTDWFVERNITSFSFELRPERGTPRGPLGGFVLPADQILPTCRETLKALSTLVKYSSNRDLELIRTSLPTARTPIPPLPAVPAIVDVGYIIIWTAAGVATVVVVTSICCCLRKNRRASN